MNQEEKEYENSFIKYLMKLKKDKNRAALAHLRRGLGKPAGTATEMYPYIGNFFPKVPNRKYEDALFLIGSLFGFYSDAKMTSGNFGDSMASIKDESGSIEKRFVALLNSNYDDLHQHLRQAVGLLKSKEKPINWEQLFKDLLAWENDSKNVQYRWARGFWGSQELKKIETEGEKQI